MCGVFLHAVVTRWGAEVLAAWPRHCSPIVHSLRLAGTVTTLSCMVSRRSAWPYNSEHSPSTCSPASTTVSLTLGDQHGPATVSIALALALEMSVALALGGEYDRILILRVFPAGTTLCVSCPCRWATLGGPGRGWRNVCREYSDAFVVTIRMND